MVPAVLWLLPEKMRLQGKDVIEHPVDAPALKPMVRDHARMLEVPTQRRPKRSVDPRLTADLRLF